MKSRKAPSIMLSISPLIIFFIISHSSLSQAHPINTRQNLEIIIGGGEAPPPETPVCPEPIPPPPPPPVECPPPPHPPPPPPSPPPPHPPPPPPPPSPRKPPSPPPLPIELQRAVKVIQRFKATLLPGGDPLGITKTWNGRICFDKSKYKGFICDTTISDGKIRVALVNFNNFNFGIPGKLPALQNFLDGLTDLIVFHSNSNNFSGGVPSGINKIPSLFELDLSNNKLHGGFPPQVLTATNLTFLDLRFNFLSGKLPPDVFKLDLDVLFLNNNYFDGEISETLGKTPALYVTLANNKFTGSIPGSIGGAADTLLEILLLGNQLSGCLPYQIGFLKKMTLFDSSVNKITGPIPHSFGCLKSLNYLNMSMNLLYGAVPEPLCKIGGLVKVTLSYNYITQVGPACRKLIARKVLDVGMNCILDLPNQRTKETCAGFFHKQQSCPDPASMNKIPCKIEYAESQPEVERKLMEQPRTYAALEVHA